MLKNFLVLVLICGCIALATSGLSTYQSTKNIPVSDFNYADLDGKLGNLYQHSNKLVILHFWATWCLPCITELPALVNKAALTPDVDFILISVDQNTQALKEFLSPLQKNMGQNITLIQDTDMELTTGIFDISQFPETIILNPNKAIRQHIKGITDWTTLKIAP